MHPVRRDYRFLFDEGVGAGDVERSIRDTVAFVESARTIDVYRLPDGRKALTFEVVFRCRRTLTTAEINGLGRVISDIVRTDYCGTGT